MTCRSYPRYSPLGFPFRPLLLTLPNLNLPRAPTSTYHREQNRRKEKEREKEKGEMTTLFTSHRQKPSLFIPSKRALSTPRKAPTSSAPPPPPTLVICSSAPAETRAATETAADHLQDQYKEEKSKGLENRTIEADFSAAPQPFLDPVLWERMKSAGGG